MPGTSSRYLDAITIALGQACKGGKKRWYASTLELQLTSLGVCRACRFAPTLRVTVDAETPRSLWCPNKEQAGPITRDTKGRVLSRVPVVRALRLIWELPFETLVESAAIELWTYTEVLGLWGSARSVASVAWPKGLKELVLANEWEVPMEMVRWPTSLEKFFFGGKYDQPITGVVWPASMLNLALCGPFNQPIAGVVWPTSLQQLSTAFGWRQVQSRNR